MEVYKRIIVQIDYWGTINENEESNLGEELSEPVSFSIDHK
ncbi:hypothetical protein [Paenibacillus sp. PCH8]|nr:hypothetical protein [Paenibacillus sp. PCH8]